MAARKAAPRSARRSRACSASEHERRRNTHRDHGSRGAFARPAVELSAGAAAAVVATSGRSREAAARRCLWPRQFRRQSHTPGAGRDVGAAPCPFEAGRVRLHPRGLPYVAYGSWRYSITAGHVRRLQGRGSAAGGAGERRLGMRHRNGRPDACNCEIQNGGVQCGAGAKGRHLAARLATWMRAAGRMKLPGNAPTLAARTPAVAKPGRPAPCLSPCGVRRLVPSCLDRRAGKARCAARPPAAAAGPPAAPAPGCSGPGSWRARWQSGCAQWRSSPRCARRWRSGADLATPLRQVSHGGWQDHAPLPVGQALGEAVTHCGDERVRRAQVDADRDAPLMRIGRCAGFGYLQESHGSGVERGEALVDIGTEALNEHQCADLRTLRPARRGCRQGGAGSTLAPQLPPAQRRRPAPGERLHRWPRQAPRAIPSAA